MADGNQKQFVVLRKDLVNFLETVRMTDKDRLALARQRLRDAISQHRYRRCKHYRPFESDGSEVSGESGSEQSHSVRDTESDRTQESFDEGASLPEEKEDAGLSSQEVSESISSLALNSEDPPPPPELKPVEDFETWYSRWKSIPSPEKAKYPPSREILDTMDYTWKTGKATIKWPSRLERSVTFKDIREADEFLDKCYKNVMCGPKCKKPISRCDVDNCIHIDEWLQFCSARDPSYDDSTTIPISYPEFLASVVRD